MSCMRSLVPQALRVAGSLQAAQQQACQWVKSLLHLFCLVFLSLLSWVVSPGPDVNFATHANKCLERVNDERYISNDTYTAFDFSTK